MRVAAVTVLSSVLVASGAGSARGTEPVRVTFVGDSVAASMTYVPAARARLARGFSVRLDLRVCRRLVQPSCSYRGHTPSTALQAVESYGRTLGKVLIVKVGYNETGRGYASGIDRIMRLALRERATHVVWVTLRESRSGYHLTNDAIRQAPKRWSQLVVADWNAFSRGQPWFRKDGVHLTPDGAVAFAGFLRPYVVQAAGAAD